MLKKSLQVFFAFSFCFCLKATAQPIVSITSPLEGTSFNVGDVVNLAANASYTSSLVSTDPNLPYLRVSKPSGAWRKLKFGFSATNLWAPLQNVILTGNNKLELTLKDLDGNIQWTKVEIHPQGNSISPVVLGNYMASAQDLGNGWYKLVIPLTAFNTDIDFSALSYLELPYSTDANASTFAISSVMFTGGTTPFEWFGASKNDNIHNGASLTADNMLASLVSTAPAPVISKVSFFANGLLLGEDSSAPYSLSWSPSNAGSYQVTAVALGSDNVSTTSAPVNITLNTVIVPPPTVTNGLSVNITSPLEGASFNIGDGVNLTANASYTPSSPTPDPNLPYLLVSKPSGAWRKLKFGYSATNLWAPLQNVILTGNDKLELTLKDLDGNIQWNKVEIHPQGNSTSPVVLGNYMSSAENLGNGWYKLVIPLTAFNTGINFSAISYLELPFSTDANTSTFAISRIVFTGGTSPFEWFGPLKNDNLHNGTSLTPDNMLATLVNASPSPGITKVSFFVNGQLIGEDINAPYSLNWSPLSAGNYQLTTVALTSDNVTSTSAPVSIIVNTPITTPPVSDGLSVVITFDTPPVNFSLSKASLRFNKKFAYSLTLDDGLISDYTNAFQVLNGGVVGGQPYPGLFYTDGCRNNIPFKGGLAWYTVNSSGKDLHTGDNSSYMTWSQLNEIYDADWDVFNHSFSHRNRGYNAQGLPNPYLPDSVYNYEINANTNYVKSHTAKAINLTHFVVPSGDDGYYLPAFKNGMKAVYDQFWQLPGNGNGLLVNNVLDFNNFKLYRATMPDDLNGLNSQIDNTANQCLTTGSRYWFNNFTHDLGTPASSGGVQFSNFLGNMNYIAGTYGKDGNDAIWMAPLQEVYEYLRVRDAAVVNSQWIGNKLYITFDLSQVPSGLRRNELSLSVQSDVPFTNVQVTGASQYSFNGTSVNNKLINLSWTAQTSSGVARQAYIGSSLEESISVVPNPAQDNVKLCSLNFGSKPFKITCYDTAGHSFMSQMLIPVNNEVTLSIADLLPGTYFLKIESNGQVYKTKKFVKQ
jgi:hypothetical protein